MLLWIALICLGLAVCLQHYTFKKRTDTLISVQQDRLATEKTVQELVSRAETLVKIKGSYQHPVIEDNLEIEMIVAIVDLSKVVAIVDANEHLKRSDGESPAHWLAARLMAQLDCSSADMFLAKYAEEREIVLTTPEFTEFLTLTQKCLDKLSW